MNTLCIETGNTSKEKLVFPLVYIVRKFEKEKEDKTMKYAIYKNGKKYLVSDTKNGAENVKRNLIERENKRQNERNCFVNLSVEIREIRECCDCIHYQECFFADQSTGICNSYKDAPKVIDSFCETIRVPFTVI